MGCCGGGSKIFVFCIELLTGQKITVGSADGLTNRMKAKVLLDHVYRHLSISNNFMHESEFLGLKYENPNSESLNFQGSNREGHRSYQELVGPWLHKRQYTWVDPNRPISDYSRSQVPMNQFYLGVKYYVPDPTRLQDESIRTQFYLQLRQQLLSADLPVSSQKDAAELTALIAQIEYGDFDKEWRKVRSQNVSMEKGQGNGNDAEGKDANNNNTKAVAKESSTGTGPGNRTSPDYTQLAIGITNSKPMTIEYDKMIYRAHKDLIGLTINEAQVRFLWKCLKLGLYGMRRFCLASDRSLWLGLSPRGLNLFEVGRKEKNKKSQNKSQNSNIPGITLPSEKLDRIGQYPWVNITGLNYDDKFFEIHHTASAHLGSQDIVTLECPTKYAAKTLWTIASEFHHFFKVKCAQDTGDPRRSSGVFTRHDRLSLSNVGDPRGTSNHGGSAFGLSASRAGSQTNVEFNPEGSLPSSKYSLARRNRKNQKGLSTGALTDGEMMHSHRVVPGGKYSQPNLTAKPHHGMRGAMTDVDLHAAAMPNGMHHSALGLNEERRRQRMQERKNDPRYRDNKQRKQQKLNEKIKTELRKHIVEMDRQGVQPEMPENGEIEYIQVQTDANHRAANHRGGAQQNGHRSRGHFTDVDGPMGRNPGEHARGYNRGASDMEGGLHQKNIKDYAFWVGAKLWYVNIKFVRSLAA